MPFQSSFGTSNTGGFSGGQFLRRRSSRRQAARSAFDIDTAEGLRALAASKGIDLKERSLEEDKDKLSFLQRLTRGLSALEPTNAFYESKYEGKNFAKEYVKDIFQEAGSAVTGREFQDDGKQKKTFKDILVKEGMKDEAGKINLVDIAGLTGDILLDPGTYLGGTILKGLWLELN
jgi:hypothetical protein